MSSIDSQSIKDDQPTENRFLFFPNLFGHFISNTDAPHNLFRSRTKNCNYHHSKTASVARIRCQRRGGAFNRGWQILDVKLDCPFRRFCVSKIDKISWEDLLEFFDKSSPYFRLFRISGQENGLINISCFLSSRGTRELLSLLDPAERAKRTDPKSGRHSGDA